MKLDRAALVFIAGAIGSLCVASTASADTPPFSSLAPGFTQTLYGTGETNAAIGVAFAANGDPLTSNPGGPLMRFNSSATVTVNGSAVHPVTSHANSDLGVGLATGTTGGLYSNGVSGVIKVDQSSGATLAGPTSVTGNGYSIATDAVSGDLMFSDGNDGDISRTPEDLSATSLFASGLAAGVNFARDGDGMVWDPSRSYLFVAGPLYDEIWVLDRSGTLVNTIAAPPNSGPDGLAFHGGAAPFLVSNNNDGTITRYDFPANDLTQAPTDSTFASGGTRGDQAAVGPDGCLYVSQEGTQYADGTLDASQGSLVQICGGFLQPVPEPYARPKGATPMRASLVPAYRQCTSGNRTHGAPLSFPSCNPPQQSSSYLTLGTPDSNGAGANGVASVLYRVKATSPSDVLISASLTDVRCKLPVSTTCGSSNTAAGPDYTGQLQVKQVLRITDKDYSPSDSGTTQDSPFPITVPCATTVSTVVGSTCAVSTSANALVPGAVTAGNRAIWALGQVQVYDGGASGTAGSPGATLFMDEGIFIP